VIPFEEHHYLMHAQPMPLLDPVRALLDREDGLVIGGEHRGAASGDVLEVLNPATGALLTTVPAAADVDDAVAASRTALPEWRRLSTARRAELLWALGEAIERRADEFAQIEALDNGKPTGESLAVDVPLCVSLFKYYAGWATKIEGESMTPASGLPMQVYTRREPVGVVAAIIPWNFPLLMCGYKLGPALAAGNTVVLKPAGVWTSAIKRAHRMAADIAAGVVWINTYGMFDAAIPYGGFKMSGFGKELGREALELYLQTKTVWVDLS
jgi:acyl-CoA reductase-like NAD-dependent aldehyde dehydrogenase